MRDHLIHKIIFRLVAPLVLGVIIYLLVLLFFDTLDSIGQNFFGIELLLCIVVSYFTFIILRQTTVLCENMFKSEAANTRRITVQVGIGLVLSLLVTWGTLHLFFNKVIGYSSYSRELTVFLALIAVISIIYNLLYFSLVFLNKQNEIALYREEEMKSTLITDFNNLMRDTRPELFNVGMEALLIQLRKNQSLADKHISIFSDIYRYNLLSRKNELVGLRDELQNLQNLIELLNNKYEGAISLNIELNKNADFSLIPSTLQILAECSVFSSIVNTTSPIDITLSDSIDGFIELKHNGLIGFSGEKHENDLKMLSDAQRYFTGTPIQMELKANEVLYKIPVIADNIEELE